MSTNTFGPTDTDYYQHAGGSSPLPAQVAMCPACRYADWTENFPDAHQERKVKQADVEAAEVYEALGQRLEANPKQAREAAWAYQQGSWCARDREDAETENRLQARALAMLEQVWEVGGIPAEEFAEGAFLLGELYRRQGHFKEAERWWSKAETAEGVPEWLSKVLTVVRPLARAGSRENAEFPWD
jgi:tetratricopeptide (TPR) repeat protein